MTADQRWGIGLLVAVLVLVGSFLGRRGSREETVAAIERSATQASAALELQVEEAQAPGVAAGVEAAIEAAAAAAAEQPAPRMPTADGPCVENVVEDARRRLPSDPDFPGQMTRRDELDDVDRDGRPEELVSFRDLCGARNCSWAIYATNDGCSDYVGTLEGAAWRVLETSHQGLHDIMAIWVAGCVGAERYEVVLEYDGREFRETSREYVNEC